MNHRSLLITLCILLAGCHEDSEFYIQPELKPYYDSFIIEAAKRNIIIKNENLVMTIEQGALARYGGNGVSRITKDQTYIYIDKDWFEKRGELIEMTVFHELGHSKLNRINHSTGFSLMNPKYSAGSGWPVCVGNVVCKDFIIDELFNGRNN